MSIFALVYLGQKTDPVMASSVNTLSLLLLSMGLLGIAVTLVFALKSKSRRAQQSPPEVRTGRTQLHLAP